jgi:hypothetical protein
MQLVHERGLGVLLLLGYLTSDLMRLKFERIRREPQSFLEFDGTPVETTAGGVRVLHVLLQLAALDALARAEIHYLLVHFT